MDPWINCFHCCLLESQIVSINPQKPSDAEHTGGETIIFWHSSEESGLRIWCDRALVSYKTLYLGIDIFLKKRKSIDRRKSFLSDECSILWWAVLRSAGPVPDPVSVLCHQVLNFISPLLEIFVWLKIDAVTTNLAQKCKHNHVYSLYGFCSKLWDLRAGVWASPRGEGCLCSQRAVGKQEKHVISWELNKLRLSFSCPRLPAALGAPPGAWSAGLPLCFQQHLFHVTHLGGGGDLLLASMMTCALRGGATEMELNPGSWKSIQWWRSNITDIHIVGLHLKMAAHRKLRTL